MASAGAPPLWDGAVVDYLKTTPSHVTTSNLVVMVMNTVNVLWLGIRLMLRLGIGKCYYSYWTYQGRIIPFMVIFISPIMVVQIQPNNQNKIQILN